MRFWHCRAASDPHLVEHRQIGADYLGHPLAGNVTQIFGDTFDPSTWAKIPDGIDFAFIDASHSYEAVRNDTEKLWPKLSPKAVVLWHDYTESVSPERGVGKYIRELMKTHPDVFICAGTDMAFRIPNPTLHEGAARLPAWYLSGDYYKRHPNGMLPWQTDFSSRQRQDRGGSP